MFLPAFVCSTCGRSFKEKFLLNHHLKIHLGEKPYKCVMCDKKFIRKPDLLRHVRAVHKKDGVVRHFKCVSCGMTFSQKRDLDHHELVKHSKPVLTSVKRKAATPEEKSLKRVKVDKNALDVFTKHFFTPADHSCGYLIICQNELRESILLKLKEELDN